MTQKEKVKIKAYNNAIEKAKEYLNSPRTCFDIEQLYNIFPELAESEEEKVRKELIMFIKKRDRSGCDYDYDKWLTWLEKQGEQKSDWSEEDENGLGDALWAIKQARTIAKDENDMGNLWYAENWLNSIKNRIQPIQSKQDWTEEDISNMQYIDSVLFYDKDLPEETCMRLRNWLQSLKPNKDMVEALRTEYEKGRADAIAEMKKPADVMDKDNIDEFAYQCAYDLSKDWLYENASWNDVQIACKLGAKWYEDHHKVQWSEEDKKMVGNIRSIIEKYAFSQSAVDVNGDLCEKKFIDVDIWLKSLKDRVQPQPKQEWSEEDEDYYDAIITKLEVTQDDAALTDNQMEFLKSLKDKLQPQPKQEWSEEDDKKRNLVINLLQKEKITEYNNYQDAYKDAINWLYSLNNKNNWKPTNDQIEAFENLVRSYGESGTLSPYDNNTKLLYSLLYNLKNI